MKKLISGICLLLFFASIALGQSTTMTIGTVSAAKIGDTVSVPVNVSNFVNVGTITLQFAFDKSAVDFAGVSSSNASFMSGVSSDGNKVTLTWYDVNNTINISSGTLLNLKFVYKGIATNLEFVKSVCEIGNKTAQPITVVYTDGKIGNNTVLSLGTPTVSGNTYSFPLNVKDFNNVGSVTLKIKYDPSVLTYTGVTNKPTKGTLSDNGQNGELLVSWFGAGSDTLNISNGKFATFNFTYSGVGQTSLSFDKTVCEVTNGAGVKIGATFVDAVVGKVPTLTLAAPTISGSTYSIPLNVKDFMNIGSVTLKIKYDPSVLTYTGVTNKPTKGTLSDNGQNGELLVSWFGAGSDTLNISNGKFATFNFTYSGVGQTSLSFDKTVCEVTNGAGVKIDANFVDASIGKVPTLTLAAPIISGNTYSIPLNVKDFMNIGSVTLKIKYDPSVLTYTGVTNKPTKGTLSDNGQNGELLVSWFGAGSDTLNISNGKFATFNFTYSGVGQTSLSFDKTVCEVTNGAGVKIDANFVDAAIGSVPTLMIASPSVSGTTVSVPMNVKDFMNIGSVTLKIKYDPSVLTYTGVANKPSKGTLSDNGQNGELLVSWFGAGSDTLNISSGKFATFNFTAKGGYTTLAFDKAICEVTNGAGVKIGANFVDGYYGKAATLAIGKVASLQNKTISVPVLVKNFKNVGAITLFFNYNNNVLEYKDYSNAPAGQFVASANNGEMAISWMNTQSIYSDSSAIVKLNFQYNGGATDMVVNTAKCEIADSMGNKIYAEFVDGRVELDVPAVFTTVMKDATFDEGKKIQFSFNANDPNNIEKLKYALVVKPAGATIDSATGLFTWTPDYKAAQTNGGKYAVVASVSKVNFTTNTDTIHITIKDVNQAPVFKIVPTPNKKDTLQLWLTAREPHDPYIRNYQFTYKAEDPDGDKITYAIVGGPTATIDSTGLYQFAPKTNVKQKSYIVISATDGRGGVTKDTTLLIVNIMTGVEPIAGVPTSYEMAQNFPNPFNPTTTIQYSIPNESKVSLKVYNLIGQEVATLVNQVQATGNYNVNFDAANLPSGIYIYRLQAGTYTQVRKMTLLK